MPREMVEASSGPGAVLVGWHPAPTGGVQVAVKDDRNSTDGHAELFVDLDRADINRLIKLLRKARDSAYGRDE